MRILRLRSILILLGLASLGVGATPGRGTAQTVPTVAVNPVWEGYQFGTPQAANIARLSVLTMPLSVHLPLTQDLFVQARSSFANAQLLRADGSSADVSGPTDTELRLGYEFGPPRGPRATLALVGLLPTGEAGHTLDQAEVAGALASELLPFRITHWSSGGGGGASVGAVGPLGRGSIGASASYLLTREFEPVDLPEAAPFLYRPGNQLQLRGTFDQDVGATGRFSLTATLLRHAEDEQAGINLYRPGNRYHAMGSYAFATGRRATGLVYLGGLHRDEGAALAAQIVPVAAQDLLLAGAGLRLPAGDGIFAPSIDFRLHRSADGIGQGYLVGIGSSMEVSAFRTLLTQSLRVRTGNLVMRDGVESPLLGVELGVSARFGGR